MEIIFFLLCNITAARLKEIAFPISIAGSLKLTESVPKGRVLWDSLTPSILTQATQIDSFPIGSKELGFLWSSEYDHPVFNPRHDYFNNRPEEYIDYYNGALHLVYTDLVLPGKGGLDLVIRREYSSKIFRWSTTSSEVPPPWNFRDSWIGRGWKLHMGRLSGLYRVIGHQGILLPQSIWIPGQEADLFWGNSLSETKYHTIFTDSTTPEFPWISETGRYFLYEWSRQFGDSIIRGISVFTPSGLEYFFSYRNICVDDRGPLCHFEIYVSFIRDANGNVIKIDYYPPPFNNMIKEITDTYGRKVIFEVDTTNVFLPVLKQIKVGDRIYRYEVSGDSCKRWLSSFTSPEGEVTKYEYGYRDSLLIKVHLPTGGEISYSYELQKFYIPYYNIKLGYYTPHYIFSWMIVSKAENNKVWKYHYHHPPPDTNFIYCEEIAPDSSIIKSYFFTYYYDINDSVRVYTPPELIGRLFKKEYYNPKKELIRKELVSYADSLGRINRFRLCYPFELYYAYPLNSDGIFLALPYASLSYDSSSAGIRGKAVVFGDATTRYDQYGNPLFIQDCGYNSGGLVFPVLRVRKDEYAWAEDPILKAYNHTGLKSKEEIYDAFGRRLKSKTEYDYYPTGRLKEDRRYDGSNFIRRNYGYDSDGNPKWFKDENGYITHYHYSFGVLDSVYDDLGLIMTRAIDPVYGLIMSQTDANGHRTSFEYDLNGRLTKIIPPITSPTNITYDLANRKITVVRGRDFHEHHYDPLGRWIYEKRILEDGVYTYNKVDYDWKGRVLREYEPSDHLPGGSDPHTEYRYDVLDRVLIRKDPDGETRYEYLGDVVKMTDPLGYLTEYHYDGLDRLVAVKDAISEWTYYDYDEPGNLIRVRMAGISDREYRYNQLSRLTFQRNPESGSVSFGYDPHGNMIEKIEADGKHYRYQYDHRHRLRKVSYLKPAGVGGHDEIVLTEYYYEGVNPPGDTFTYINPKNHLTCARDGDIYVYYLEYDDEERLKRKLIRFADLDTSFEVGYEYDRDGNLVGIHYPSGLELVQDVHPSGLVRSITVGDTLPILTQVNYNPALGPKRIEYANGIITLIPPDPRNRPDEIRIGNYLTLDYSYDSRGDIDKITTNGRIDRYHYDALDRLVRVDYGDGKWISYEYDRFGNMTTADGSFPQVNFYNRKYRDNRIVGFDYSPRGNLLYDSLHQYQYDHFNRLVSVDGKVGYRYNHAGKRMVKVFGNHRELSFYDEGLNILSEFYSQTR